MELLPSTLVDHLMFSVWANINMGLVLAAAVNSKETLLVWGESELQTDLFLFLLKAEKYF